MSTIPLPAQGELAMLALQLRKAARESAPYVISPDEAARLARDIEEMFSIRASAHELMDEAERTISELEGVPTALARDYPALAKWADAVLERRGRRSILEVAAAFEATAIDHSMKGEHTAAGEALARARQAVTMREAV